MQEVYRSAGKFQCIHLHEVLYGCLQRAKEIARNKKERKFQRDASKMKSNPEALKEELKEVITLLACVGMVTSSFSICASHLSPCCAEIASSAYRVFYVGQVLELEEDGKLNLTIKLKKRALQGAYDLALKKKKVRPTGHKYLATKVWHRRPSRSCCFKSVHRFIHMQHPASPWVSNCNQRFFYVHPTG